MDEFSAKPYTPWLEEVIKDLIGIDPVCVAMQMRDAEGKVYTCYWNCDRNDRACMVDAMQDDGLLEFFSNNKDEILEILNEEDDDGL